MTGQQLITEVEILRGAIKTSNRDVLNRIFDLNDRLTTVKAKRNCVNCATECLGRLMILGKKYRNEEIPTMKGIIGQSTIKGQTKTLETYNILVPFRPFGHKKTYSNLNTTDAEVEALLKIEPQHLLRFTLADGSPVVLSEIGKKEYNSENLNHVVSFIPSDELSESQKQNIEVLSNSEVIIEIVEKPKQTRKPKK